MSSKEDIIAKTIDLMYLNGYNGTSVNDIAKQADIPKGSFYYYFKTKEDYTVEALRHYFGNINTSSVLADETLPPLERIHRFFLLKVETLEKRGFKYGCFLGNLASELADVNDRVSAEVHSCLMQICSAIKHCLDLSRVDFGIDSGTLANSIMGSWQGALLLMKSSGDRKPLDDFMAFLRFVLDEKRA